MFLYVNKISILLSVFIFITACGSNDQYSSEINSDHEETQRMIKRLKQISQNTDPMTQRFMNNERVELLTKMFADGSNLSTELQYAIEQLRAGQSLMSVELIKDILNSDAAKQLSIPQKLQISKHLAIAYMRLGEQSNCVMMHSSQSCLFPINQQAIHQNQLGSIEAIGLYLTILKEQPNDLVSKWLLNLAAMTVGQHPNAVPEAHRISEDLFKSDIEMPAFINKAKTTHTDVLDLAGGSVIEDFNNDGFLDIMTSAWGHNSPIKLLINNQQGHFIDETNAAGLSGLTGGLNMVQADYDNDGDTDVLILRGAWLLGNGKIPNSLLQNNGKGQFIDVTESSGLLSFKPTQTASWADFDQDGNIDLFIGNESLMNDVNSSELFRNNGDGTFTETAKKANLNTSGYIKGSVWGDFNNDNKPDLYVSRMDLPNQLFKNISNGSQWRFIEVANKAGVTEPVNSFPTWFWDFNNDGWLDIFVADYNLEAFITDDDNPAEQAAHIIDHYLNSNESKTSAKLYQNNGDGTFSDVTDALKLNTPMLAMGANFGDIDNDGYLDFYIGTGDPNFKTLIPNRLFRNNQGMTFQDVTTTTQVGHLQKGHGVSFGDLDNDGDQDIYTVLGGAYAGDKFQNALFENPGHGNNWITLRLIGSESNRSAIGAKITVSFDENYKNIHRTITSGGSFGASSLQSEIGLGKAQVIKQLLVKWPSGQMTKLNDLGVNQIIQITEGINGFKKINTASIQF